MPCLNALKFLRCLLFSTALLAAAASAKTPAEVVKNGRPILKPEQYFAGRTHSWGVFESRSGNPTKLIHTQTQGRVQGGVLRFEQDLQIERSKNSHRSWLIRRVDEHHYTATGSGIVGTARGEAYGNALHLEFTIDAVPGNPLAHLHMSQWLYLQPDGRTLINRATITKGGITLAQVTEQFQKDR